MKQFLWKSSFNSPDKKQVSLLAIAETFAAILLYGWIAYKWGTLHLCLAAVITPFLLLRTEESTILGLKWGKYAFSYWSSINFDEITLNLASKKNALYVAIPVCLALIIYVVMDKGLTGESLFFAVRKFSVAYVASLVFVAGVAMIFLLIFIGFFPLIGLMAIRVVATIYTVAKHPAQSLKNIPENWWRMVARIDTFFPPEPIPGVIKFNHQTNELTTLNLLKFWRRIRAHSSSDASIYYCLAAIFFVSVFIPSFLYRWSLKGTSIFWSPLIWALRSSYISDFKDTLESIKSLALYKVMRIYSAFVIGLIVSKLFGLPYLNDLALAWKNSPASNFIFEFIAPSTVPLWQVAALINALLAWLLYFMSDYMLFKYGKLSDAVKKISLNIIQCMFFVRSILSLYTVSITIFIAFDTTWKLSPIGTDLFPKEMLHFVK